MKKYLINFFALIGFITFILFISSQTSDILLNGTVSAENNQIKNVAEPTDDNDAVNKSFLDSNISALTNNIGKYQASAFENKMVILNTETGVLKSYYTTSDNWYDFNGVQQGTDGNFTVDH